MAWSIMGQHAGARNASALKGPNIRTEDQFEREVENVKAAAVIPEQESDQLWLWLLHLIAQGTPC